MRTPPRVIPALITPFDEAGELDIDSYQHNLAELTRRGIGGFLVGGSTGEGPYLEAGERRRLLEAAREGIGPVPTLFCGVAAESQREALRQIEEASAGQADAVLVTTPTTLVRGDHQAVADHYSELAHRSPLPVMIYSVPSYTAYAPPTEIVADLSEVPNIAGIKDSGGDPVRIGRIVQAVPDGFFVFAGASRSVHLAIVAGAYGAITASCNYVPDLVRHIVEESVNAPETARKLQSELTAMVEVVEHHRVSGVKIAAAEIGLRPGHARLPLPNVDEGTQSEIRTAVAPV